MDKIICVGKNYLKHAHELGDAVPDTATYFIKPPSTLCAIEKPGQIVHFPVRDEIHHEVELVLRFKQIKERSFTFSHYTFGVDLTDRGLQAQLKKSGQPWEKAKVFENSAIIGPWRELTSMEELLSTEFSLSVNGARRQLGVGRDMRFGPGFLLADLPQWFPVRDGDILFTGTPEGVGPLIDGDAVEINGGNITYSFKCGTRLG